MINSPQSFLCLCRPQAEKGLNEEEKRVMAAHESGHALVALLLFKEDSNNADMVTELSLLPATDNEMAYLTVKTPQNQRHFMSEKFIRNKIICKLAGRATEEIVLRTKTTGAAQDIQGATQLAYLMASELGMSRLGPVSFTECSNDYASMVEKEVRIIIFDCYEEAKKLIVQNRRALKAITDSLLSKERISGKNLLELINEARN